MLVVTLSFENNIYVTLMEVMGVHTPTFVACKTLEREGLGRRLVMQVMGCKLVGGYSVQTQQRGLQYRSVFQS